MFENNSPKNEHLTPFWLTFDWNIIFVDLRNRPGGRLNKKDGLTKYGDSHVKDKTS